jgi:hypothetical protein
MSNTDNDDLLKVVFTACGKIDGAINEIADKITDATNGDREQILIDVIESCIEGLAETLECCNGHGILDHLVENISESESNE